MWLSLPGGSKQHANLKMKHLRGLKKDIINQKLLKNAPENVVF